MGALKIALGHLLLQCRDSQGSMPAGSPCRGNSHSSCSEARALAMAVSSFVTFAKCWRASYNIIFNFINFIFKNLKIKSLTILIVEIH